VGCTYLRFWNQTLICLGSMLRRMGQSLTSCCRRSEEGLGHSLYTRSSASTCSGVYRTYLPVSTCGAAVGEGRLATAVMAAAARGRGGGRRELPATARGLPWLE
jgi:hypothetical protein